MASPPLLEHTGAGDDEASRDLTPAVWVCKAPEGIESIDFDPYESKQRLQAQQTGRSQISCLLRWSMVSAVGISTGLLAFGIDFMVQVLTQWRFGSLRSLISIGSGPIVLVSVHLAFCVAYAAVAAALVCFVSPLAAGSGIPEVKCRLNGVDVPLVVKPSTLVAKAAGVLFSVAAGLPCGKEGPMIHSGSILGALASRVVAFSLPLYDWDVETRDLIAAGGAAGVAAAFGAPIGGVLFALEEGASFWNSKVMLQCIVCSASSALTLNFFLGGLNSQGFGTLGALGVLTFGNFFQSNNTSYRIWEMPIFAALGALGGLAGASFIKLNVQLTRWRMRRVGARGRRRFIEALIVAAGVAMVLFFAPLIAGSCYVTSVQETPNADSQYIICDPGHSTRSTFETTLGLFVTPSEDSIKVLFHDPLPLDSILLAGFGVTYFSIACLTYGLGVPSGLFVPSLLIGSVLGRLIGQFLKPMLAGLASPGTYALVGAAASLGGMARITISLTVILVESTGNIQYLMPILFTVIVAKSVGDLFNKGIYDVHIDLKHIPFLEALAHDDMHMLAGDIMCYSPIALESKENVQTLLNTLEQHSHNAFPVVQPGTKQFCGLLSRGTLLQMLLCEHQQGLDRGSVEDDTERGALAFVHSSHEMQSWPSLDQIRELLTPQDYLSMFDLRPYLNRDCLVVQETASLRRAYSLFRTMGLRHLPVVKNDNRLCGIITRKDLVEERIQAIRHQRVNF